MFWFGERLRKINVMRVVERRVEVFQWSCGALGLAEALVAFNDRESYPDGLGASFSMVVD